MYARIATLVTVIAVAFLTLASPSMAGPVPMGSDPSVTLNRQLATLAQAGTIRKASPGERPVAGASAFAPVRGKGLSLSPAILSIAAHFTKAERLLHFQSHGLDANFWGALSGGRVKLQYSVKF